jgi:hypothetical protein
MAVTAITPVQLALNTASADLPDAAGTVATTPADGWSITLGAAGIVERMMLKFLADGSGDTVTILAGDSPLAVRAGLGNLAITLAANDVKHIYIEAARFLHDDNTIKATCTDAGTSVIAFLSPKGIGGGSGVA